eukprot:g30.t1
MLSFNINCDRAGGGPAASPSSRYRGYGPVADYHGDKKALNTAQAKKEKRNHLEIEKKKLRRKRKNITTQLEESREFDNLEGSGRAAGA